MVSFIKAVALIFQGAPVEPLVSEHLKHEQARDVDSPTNADLKHANLLAGSPGTGCCWDVVQLPLTPRLIGAPK